MNRAVDNSAISFSGPSGKKKSPTKGLSAPESQGPGLRKPGFDENRPEFRRKEASICFERSKRFPKMLTSFRNYLLNVFSGLLLLFPIGGSKVDGIFPVTTLR